MQHITRARAIAGELKYHELQFEADRLFDLLKQDHEVEATQGGGVLLSDQSQYIVTQLDETGEHDLLRVTIPA